MAEQRLHKSEEMVMVGLCTATAMGHRTPERAVLVTTTRLFERTVTNSRARREK